ncbi:hypothetical protein LINPERPRIM_LOCUS36271 [Linum perenne]
MERSWHVHNTTLVLRRWYARIEPVDLSKKPAPVRVSMENVPPQIIIVEGVSWLASQLGKPVNKFIREGLTVKVCMYLNLDSKDVLTVVIGDKQVDIDIKYPTVRRFANATMKVWHAREVKVSAQNNEPVTNGAPQMSNEPTAEVSSSVPSFTDGIHAMFPSLHSERKEHLDLFL